MSFKPAGEPARGWAVFPRGGNGRHLRSHVVDEEAEDPRLRGDVEKLGGDGHHKVRMRPDGMRNVRRRVVEVIVVLHFNVRNIGKIEYDGENDDDNPDGGVRNPELLGARALASRVFGIKKHAASNRSEKQTDAVARLREIDAGRSVFNRPQNGRVRIGDGFEKGKTRGNDADTQQKCPKGRDLSRRNEPKSPNRN